MTAAVLHLHQLDVHKMKLPARTQKQELAFSYADKYPYSIIAKDPRLGKSRVAIEIREKYKNNCLIVCPSYLVPNWRKEILKWAGPKLITMFEKGSDIYDVFDSDYVIISFDLAQKAEWLFEWCDMLIIDEGHHLKSMSAKRTQFIHKNVFENSIKRVHILTGTPLKNRVKEFYSLLALMCYDPRAADSQFLDLYPTEIDFADRFSDREEFTMEIKNRYVQIVKWSGLKNVEELKKWLKGKYIRIRADKKDLPPLQTIPTLVSNSTDPNLWKAFESYFNGGKDGERESVMPKFKAEAALKKVPFTIKYADDLLEKVKCVLIYSDHVASAEAIAAHFGVRALTGKVPSKLRSKLATAFQNGEGKVCVATIGALKEGKDLFRSNDVLFNDQCWVPGDMVQAINRIRIMGDKTPKTVHKIFGSPQDEKISTALEEKMAVINAAT